MQSKENADYSNILSTRMKLKVNDEAFMIRTMNFPRTQSTKETIHSTILILIQWLPNHSNVTHIECSVEYFVIPPNDK